MIFMTSHEFDDDVLHKEKVKAQQLNNSSYSFSLSYASAGQHFINVIIQAECYIK